jgi:hypothetical protein
MRNPYDPKLCQHTVCPSDRGSGFYGDPPRQCERKPVTGSDYCWQHKAMHNKERAAWAPAGPGMGEG